MDFLILGVSFEDVIYLFVVVHESFFYKSVLILTLSV